MIVFVASGCWLGIWSSGRSEFPLEEYIEIVVVVEDMDRVDKAGKDQKESGQVEQLVKWLKQSKITIIAKYQFSAVL